MIAPYYSKPYRAVFVELKNLVLKTSPKGIRIPSNDFKSILYCNATAEYHCGRITRDEYHTRLASDFHYSKLEIKETFASLQSTLSVNHDFVASLAQLKAQYGNNLELYATANLSQEDYQAVQALDMDWSPFSKVFVSCEIGAQKPELRFYKAILEQVGLRPHEVILVDDDPDNVLAAMSLGIEGVLCPSMPVIQTIVKLFDYDTIGRAKSFLRNEAGNCYSVTDTGVTVKENFAQLLLLELTGDSEFKNRVDPVVCCNVLNLFYQYGRGSELSETLNWVEQVLRRRAYINGTCYYPKPEAFFYFLSRFLRRLKGADRDRHARLAQILAQRLQERIGIEVDDASLAMRLIALNDVGMRDRIGLETLIRSQREDGGWAMGTLYQYYSKRLQIGNRATCTALAIEAITRCQDWLNDEDGPVQSTYCDPDYRENRAVGSRYPSDLWWAGLVNQLTEGRAILRNLIRVLL
ncbi:hypothetical protein AtubIFM55763_011079 [Aspergillus tubingensis]|uniref:Uncharacterized protein n=1 Tax=Aspergillus tubingensis TaxID=5068 RepID=A0A9W6AT95_ASPTU|nr:hypothetical protein AtubIFM54640_002263 [Aspergillus tubingensis]GLA78350.1 hypothetical protein AtubIFM55763_011079 [Aspergillus tubingensis]GLA88156.1 hypothetical protein AtubIFM56815_002597 [Aspergillus tubingensis]